MPILIFGESGSGKTFISSLISEYALNNKIIQKGEDIIYVNCMRYQNNSINFIKLINKIIEQEKKRKLIITFDDIHLLETEAIELSYPEGKSSAFFNNISSIHTDLFN
ncbi:MAG: AAA family ATPase [Anaerobutyricum sp.]